MKGRRLLYVLFPNRCALCGQVIPADAPFCAACSETAPYMLPPVCPLCGRSEALCRCRGSARQFERCVMPFRYVGSVRRAIARFKREGCGTMADAFADEMAEVLRREYGALPFAAVTAVPLHRRALRRREFNPAELLARRIAKKLALPYVPLLTKLYETPPQKALSAVNRQGNLLGVFDVSAPEAVAGKTVLLVDDVITTGATLNECAKMLKLYGAEAVYAVTICGTVAEDKMEEAEKTGQRGETV